MPIAFASSLAVQLRNLVVKGSVWHVMHAWASILQVPAVLVLDVASPDLPTARLEHKAHLTLNEFDKIVLQEVRKAQNTGTQALASLSCHGCSCAGHLGHHSHGRSDIMLTPAILTIKSASSQQLPIIVATNLVL